MTIKNYRINGISELMLFHCILNKTELTGMTPDSLKQIIDQKLLDESDQVFLLDKDNFSFIGEKQVASSIQYTERDHLPEIEKDYIRLVFWEEFGGANVNIDIPENIDEVSLVIDGNTFGCMDDWGFETFADYSFIAAGKELDIYFNSESYGEQKDKVVYLINSSGNCESIRDLDCNDNFKDELLEAFEALALK